MAVSATRIVATAIVAVALLLMGLSLANAWWGFARERSGAKNWERYGPFERDAEASGGQMRTETTVLGWLVVAALAGLAVALVAQVFSVSRSRSTGAAILGMVAVLLVAAAVLYPVVAFPNEINRERGLKMSFVDRDCNSFFGAADICFVTQPGPGWYLAASAGVMTLAALVARRVGRTDAEPEVAPLPAPTRVAVVKPAGLTPGSVPAPNAPTRVTKCPQCQTRVTYRKPVAGAAMAECHNCGLRFPG